jgi:Fe-Mn family superoxide dismutase
LYFANLGGDGKASGELRTRIAASFGTFDAWESEFRKIGQGLAGGSGWVVADSSLLATAHGPGVTSVPA